MIFKKKNSYKFIENIRNYLSKILITIGLFSSIIFFIIILYYFSSGMSHRFSPINLIKSVDRVILDKYVGFSIFEIDEYFKLKINSLKLMLIKNKLEDVKIVIDQENLYNLELQRQQRLGKIPKNENDLYKFSDGQILYNQNKFRIKLRVKGDRLIHWYDKSGTSYKIDLRGTERLWGLEEFSVQKPITRNYIYEYIFHKLLKQNGLISLNYFFVNLYFNDSNQGVYAVEEGFSKELIERNKRRNGPIFGIDEVISDDTRGIVYPNVQYDLYSKEFWINNYPDLTSNALAKLNNFKVGNIDLEQVFDLDKWATYFAVIDLTNARHGAISKSVKLFYNPVNAKFEPIGFDAHIGTKNNKNFLLIDLLDKNNKNCSGICYDREWILSFFLDSSGKPDKKFIDLYLEKLKKVSSDEFLSDFYKKYSDKIKFYNSQIYLDNSKKDQGGMYKGLGFYIYDDLFLQERSDYIKERIKNIENIQRLQYSLNSNQIIFDNINKFFLKKIKIICNNELPKSFYIIKNQTLNYNKNCNYFIGENKIDISKNFFLSSEIKNGLNLFLDLSKEKKINHLNNIFYLSEDLIVKNNFFLSKDKKLIVKQGVKIIFETDSIILSEGKVFFEGTKENPIIIRGKYGNGSIILSNNTFNFDNVVIQNLSYPKDKSKILYGGINIINSNLNIKNTQIESSNSEDAINIISSNTFIKNLNVKKIKADAIDIDFGELKFESITCENINNDCLDASGAHVDGNYLVGKNISDKGLSFGENSNGEIINVNFTNSKLGVAVKDGSKLTISNYKFLNNNYDIAVFNKKKEYDGASLEITNSPIGNNPNYLIGLNNHFRQDNIVLSDKVDNKLINELFY